MQTLITRLKCSIFLIYVIQIHQNKYVRHPLPKPRDLVDMSILKECSICVWGSAKVGVSSSHQRKCRNFIERTKLYTSKRNWEHKTLHLKKKMRAQNLTPQKEIESTKLYTSKRNWEHKNLHLKTKLRAQSKTLHLKKKLRAQSKT